MAVLVPGSRDPYLLVGCTSLQNTDSASPAFNEEAKNLCTSTSTGVRAVASNDLSLSQFAKDCMSTNEPILVTVRGISRYYVTVRDRSLNAVGSAAGCWPRLEVLG